MAGPALPEPPIPAAFAARLSGDRKTILRVTTSAVYAAVELGVLEALAGGKSSLDELASVAGARPERLVRLLAVLRPMDVVHQEEPRRYSAGPMARFVPSAVPPCYGLDPHNSLDQAWARLGEAIRSGRTAIELAFGTELFDLLARNPVALAEFQAQMAARGAIRDPAIAAAGPFAPGSKVVDLGGGNGALMKAIIDRHPDVDGAVFDLPEVIEAAEHELNAVPGSLFESVPGGFDVYVLSSVIHDWGDDRAQRILANTRAAMRPDATLLVVELVLPVRDEPFFGWISDLEMLALTGGRERTIDDYRNLLAAAGLSLAREIETGTSWSLLEASPA